MINNISFVSKIIIMVTIAFILSFSTIYYVIFENYKKILLEEQLTKINILLNTVSPIVKINLEFNIINNIDKAFTRITNSNKDIKSIKLISLDKNIISKKIINNENKNTIKRTKKLIDKHTNKTIAYLEISYSNVNYINAVNKFQNMFIIIGMGFIIFIVLFTKLLLYNFKPILSISKKLETFDPKNTKNLKITKMKGKNEIVIINNTIINMLEKINSHTKNLQDEVKSEIKKNDEKEQFMIQQSRLAQVGEMISMIAHQWRQPLSSISSTTSALELKIMLDDYDSDYFNKQIKNISNYSQYLSSTIDDFRNFFKSNNTKVETTLEEIIEDSLKISRSSIENKGIIINKNILSNQNILTFKNEIQQVVLNLLKNAEDILMEKDIKEPYITIKTYEKDMKNIIEVSDNGLGIPKEIIEKIFDPYFTTKEKRDGTGLGLYMSKRIIENRCGGKLKVTNNDDGVTFQIIL